MPPAIPPETLYWGLRFADWISFAGLVLGPIVAVAITLWVEGRRRKREQRMQVMRMILTTRHLVSDPAYSVAINLIPSEFNGNKDVMAAWRSYIETVRFKPVEENRGTHDKMAATKQTDLIFQLVRAVGFKLTLTDIQTSAYAAEGYVQRDNILVASQLAMTDIAKSMRQQTELMQGTPAPAPPVNQIAP